MRNMTLARRIISIFLLATWTSPHAAESQALTPGQRLVEEFLDIAAKRALNGGATDWPAHAARAREKAKGATDTLSAYPIIAETIKASGDEHGGLQPTDANTEAYTKRYGGLWAVASSRRPLSVFFPREHIEFRDVAATDRSVRIVVVPRVFTSDDEQAYADAVFASVTGAPSGTCGYIVDLRGNMGGDMWPMLVGLSPLLGNGDVGAFTDRIEPALKWHLKDAAAGVLRADGRWTASFELKTWRKPSPDLLSAPVAVLIDDGVLSSGEAVAIAFKGRAQTRLFGAQTYGLTTANTPFPLSDGTTLYLATGVYQDRNGRNYTAGVAPDVAVEPGKGDGSGREPAVDAAAAWLMQQPACRTALEARGRRARG